MYTNYSKLLRFLTVIGFILFVANSDANADPVTVLNHNTQPCLKVQLKSGAIDKDFTSFEGDRGDWIYSIGITEDDRGAALSDTLKITINITHFSAPHGEERKQGPEIVFNIDAGSFALLGMKHTEFRGPFSVTHGVHTDIYFARLDFETTSIGEESHHIDRYTLTIMGKHEVPEPSSLVMAGIGLTLFVYRRITKARHKGKG